MNGKAFVDSNIWLYLLGNDLPKKQKALQLLHQNHLISTQVLAENSNVCRQKFHLDIPTTKQHVRHLFSNCQVVVIQPEYIFRALSLSDKYQFGFYDSLIVATALENDCRILYSEDLQNGQVIEGKLKIVNPF
jgi:predicted nucleic acid-binding protein